MKDETLKSRIAIVCQSIYDRHGEITTRQLIEEARPEESPAHAAFTWDDSIAGERYREIEARTWIRRIEIVREDEPERLIHVPRIAKGDDTDGTREGHYQVASKLVGRPDEFSRALDQAQAKLAAAQRAVSDLLKAAETTGRTSEAAMIAQMSKATAMWAKALRAMH